MTFQPLSALPAPTLAQGLHLQLVLDRSLPALLPASQLVEILTVAIGQVVPIFQLPPWAMGVYNWRGEVLWMVDLNHLLGLTPWYEQVDYGSKHTVVVLQEAGKSKERAIVGLVVNRVEDMVDCTADQLYLLSELDSGDASPDSLSNSLLDSHSLSASDFQTAPLPANLHRFFTGYWHSKTAPRHWLLNSAAILQSLTETPF